MNTRKTTLLLLLSLMCAGCTAAALAFTLVTYDAIGKDVALIGTVGTIRGGIQRYAKLRLAGADAADAGRVLDGAFDEAEAILEGMDGLGTTRDEVAALKRGYLSIAAVQDGDETGRMALIGASESLWPLVDSLALEARLGAERRTSALGNLFALLGTVLALSILLAAGTRVFVRNRLEFISSHDALSGLKNRASFKAFLDAELARSARSGEPFSLVILDMDNFKAFNDRYGRDAGDRAIRLVSHALGASLRGSDLAFRVGGDEFAVLLPLCGLEQAKAVAAKAVEAVARADFPEGGLALSAGVSAWSPGSTGDAIYKEADISLCAQKHAKASVSPS